MGFQVQYVLDTGFIVGTWQGGDKYPEGHASGIGFINYPEWQETHGKRINTNTQQLEDCPIYVWQEYNNDILRQLQAIDDRTPRALREALLGDASRLQVLEDEASELRSQLTLNNRPE